jgi:hypothetical protein
MLANAFVFKNNDYLSEACACKHFTVVIYAIFILV